MRDVFLRNARMTRQDENLMQERLRFEVLRIKELIVIKLGIMYFV